MRKDSAGTGPDPAGPDMREEFFRLREAISDRFEVEDLYISGKTIRFIFREMRGDFDSIREEFKALGYYPYLKTQNGRHICILTPARVGKDGANKRATVIAWVLFAATFVTTTIAGYGQGLELAYFGVLKNPWLGAFEFSIPLLLILGAHEMAHKWATIRNGIDSSPPYFIPFPSIIGTMGAVIRIKSPTPDRNAAVALGISGPLAGFLIAVPVLVAGLYMSPVIPVSMLQSGSEFIKLGDSLLMAVATRLILEVPANHEVFLHPLAMAGWVGLLVTGLNLIPMGQLDGGHVAHAVLGHRMHELVSRVLVGILFATGAAAFMSYNGLLGPLNDFAAEWLWPGWLVWGAFGFFIVRRGYPATLNDSEPVSAMSRVWGIVAIVIFILCFIPNPIRV